MRCERAVDGGQCPETAVREVPEDGWYCETHAAEAEAEYADED